MIYYIDGPELMIKINSQRLIESFKESLKPSLIGSLTITKDGKSYEFNFSVDTVDNNECVHTFPIENDNQEFINDSNKDMIDEVLKIHYRNFISS